ncbi:DUF5712 family protein [Pelobium manganitolerans]|uniref:DUF5712 family protein n=1 Tax=Pelobium manganitolerans TaxID=1842495 RepID=UPI003FA3BF1F
MHINISTQGANKASSSDLVHYLEKENRTELKTLPELWFTSRQKAVQPYELRRKIDANTAKLGRNDAKFFLINISPSQKEIRHLKEVFGEEGAKVELKKYAERVMDEYAKNFYRPAISNNEDLLWFGKLENFRYFSYIDKEVKSGMRKRGEKKEGEQMHIQIIVSRKDKANKFKLSPMNNSRGKNEEHSIKLGQFNRLAFKHCGETLFDERFGFNRQLKDTLAYANIKKNGTRNQHVALERLKSQQVQQVRINLVAKELSLNGNIGDKNFVELLTQTESCNQQMDYQFRRNFRKKSKRRIRRPD